MKKLLFSFIFIFLAIGLQAQTPDANGIVYVKTAVAGDGNGNSWTNATDNLQGAIDAAGVSQVWVAKGEYPLAANKSYKMKNGVAIYGSFPDTGTPVMIDRNFTTNSTILKGNGKSVIDNYYFSATRLTNSAILNGFKITGGGGNSGAGIINNYSSPVLSNVTISGNTASNNGGGIYNNNYSSPVLTNVTISGNAAGEYGYGGGIWNGESSSAIFTNVTIIGNTSYQGGGIFISGSSEPILTNVTISGNVATDQGGGIYISFNSALKLKNSIVLGNNIGNVNDSRSINTNSLVQGLTAKTGGNISSSGITAAQVFTSPVAAGLNSGGDYTLKLGSPVISEGNNDLNTTILDLAGNTRIQRGYIDLGAYESAFSPTTIPEASTNIVYVKENGAGNFKGNSWANATDNLQGAIDATGVSQVWVAKGEYPLAANKSYKMKNGVAIYGSFPDTGNPILTSRSITKHLTTLVGNSTTSVIANPFTNATPLLATAILDGFKLTGGGGDYGAGMHNLYASPTLTNLIISGNATGHVGGGVYNKFSSPVLTNVAITGNTASGGGGFYNTNNSSPILTNVTISGNYAQYEGGAIYNWSPSIPKLRNCIILGNSSGIFSSEMPEPIPVYTNSLVQGFSATTDGNIDATGITAEMVFNAPLATPGLSVSGDFTLKTGSKVINVGNQSFYGAGQTPNLSAVNTDLAGNPRIQKGKIDLGAYESSYIELKPTSGTVYVKSAFEGLGDGSNWANATDNLQLAIDAPGVSQVWVAKGTYPLTANTSYKMKNGVAIYGNFPDNGNPKLTDRNVATHLTTLMGDGSATVVYNNFTSAEPLLTTAILDGFNLTGGFGNDGGGLYNFYASPTLTNLIISGNTATLAGGGIHNHNSSPILRNITVKGNTSSGDGAGIYNKLSSPILTNVTITGNNALVGGGFYNDDSSPTLTNVTISGNVGNYGGGISNSNSSKPKIRNSIVVGNNTGVANTIDSGPLYTSSLVQDLTETTNGNISASGITAAMIFTSPLATSGLSVLGDFTLKNGSVAVNAGSQSFYGANQTPDLAAVTTDLANNNRVQKGEIDLGAYESAFVKLTPTAGIIYVKLANAGSADGSSWVNATASLQLAIDATGVSQVWVAKGEYQLATGSSYKMKNGVAIYGSFPDTGTPVMTGRNFTTQVTILKGNGKSVIKNDFINSQPLLATAILDGFKITGGSGSNGAGIYNSYSSPVLTNVIISGNAAPNTGGGISNENNSSPVLTNVTITGNTATFAGGGIYNNESSSPILTNVTISGNNASRYGGEVFNTNSSNPVFRNSIVLGTSTGVYNDNITEDVPVYTNSLVQGLNDITNGNLDATGITATQVFTAPEAAGLSSAGNYTLKLGSPAINGGNNTLNTTTLDIVGNTRIQKGTMDLGAYESAFYPTLIPEASTNIVYVKENGAGNFKGNNWANATSNLQGAIDATDVSQVWVAKGEYALAANTSYKMKNGVAIYGSFPDTGTPVMTDRNFTTQVTTLKGNGASVIKNDYSSTATLTNTAVLNGFKITGGSGNNGAGIYNSYSSPVLTNVTISGNATPTNTGRNGGGIYNTYSSPLLTNVSITGNFAPSSGGGICNESYSSPILTNVSITGNAATYYGAGIFNGETSSLKLSNVTISGNNSSYGDGGVYDNSTNTTIENSIIFGNVSGSIKGSSTSTVYTNSLVEDLTDTGNGNISSGSLTANDIFNAPSTAYSGTAGDYTLKAGSVAINAGDNAENTTTLDLAGNTRIQKGNIDLGAYESSFSPTPIPEASTNIVYVKENGAGNFKGNSWANATDNLQGAIDAKDVIEVWVAKGTYQLAANTSYKMKNGVAIYGSFPDTGTPVMTGRNFTTQVTTLKGNLSEVIANSFNDTQPLVASAILDGFKLTNGSRGISNSYASPTLTNLIINGNIGTAQGGGVFNSNSSPTLTNVILSGNTADSQGGGIFNSNSSPTLTNVILSGNTADSQGGGIFNSNSSPTLTNVIISGNTADVQGGGIYNGNNSSPILTNVTISANVATSLGGGIYNNNSNPMLRNSVVLGNNTGIYDGNNAATVCKYSLVQDLNVTTNGNISANGVTAAQVFTAPVAAGLSSAGDYSLKASSLAINAGSQLFYGSSQTPDLSAITTDLAGNARVFDDKVDMGAYEYPEANVLPITLTAFIATAQNNGAKLRWTTSSEQKNKAFIISRSEDAVNFKVLATVAGHGTTNAMQTYLYIDTAPLNGTNYYRLQQIDFDGKLTSLGVKALDFNLKVNSLKVYPNPVVAVATVQFQTSKYNNIALWDINGKLLQQFEIKAPDTLLHIDFSGYPSGTYLIKASGAGVEEIDKVIKN